MLFFLMKMDGRVRLQLFLLALIVGSEIVPAVEGLDCYSCGLFNPGDCDTSTIDKGCGTCIYDLDDNGNVVKKGCLAKGIGSASPNDKDYTCALKISRDGCFIQSTENVQKHLNCYTANKRGKREVEETTPEPKERNYFKDSAKVKRCYCNNNLCNTGTKKVVKPSDPDPDVTVTVTTTEPGPKGSGLKIAPIKGYPLCLVLLVSLWFNVTRRNYNP